MRSMYSRRGNHARRMRALLAGTAISAAATLPAAAQNATWLVTPGTNNYNTAANWNSAAVPTGHFRQFEHDRPVDLGEHDP
jgi:hypothetical protein